MMAPPITIVDQNRFLISCIKNANQGKVSDLAESKKKKKNSFPMQRLNSAQVDFDKVAQECNIVTRAAA